MSRPWLSIAASVKRKASAPYLSIRPERIDRIALRLGHLLPVGVADEAVEIERLPRFFAHEVSPCIAMRASQKNRMSKPEISTSLG
jgi:hypothetical protein